MSVVLTLLIMATIPFANATEIPDGLMIDGDFAYLMKQLEQAHFHWQPRPDQPERYDQQTSFVNSKTTGVKWLIGGNGAGTTECTMAAVSRFLMETPPPRHDTPFWVIAGTYEQVCEACWKEKLHGHGHIPDAEIDWDRISWYKPKQGWPFRVPLKPWPGREGKNWVVEFKSYEQGRAQMQARSIGGFCFVEQFPYVLLTEVLRGCREYNFPGSKMVEFTPIDPDLSVEIEQLIENDSLPDGWEVYRANTECAMEAGHVSKEWFTEFYGMIPEEMRDVRMTGAFASYEGTIYKEFNPLVHIVDDDVICHPPGVHYLRSLDWGAGPSNAQTCVYAYKDNMGRYYVFDEYYSTEEITLIEHLMLIADKHPWPASDPHYGCTYADPSGRGYIRIAQSISQYAPGYEDFYITSAANSVLPGIEHVKYMLKDGPAAGDPEPRLYIHKRCENLIREMRKYRWKRQSVNGINPQDARAEPLKKDDHLVDALRYMLYTESTSTGETIESIARSNSAHKSYGIPFQVRP